MSLAYNYPYNQKIVKKLKKNRGVHQWEPSLVVSTMNSKKKGGAKFVQPGSGTDHVMYNSDEQKLFDQGTRLGYGKKELLSSVLDMTPQASMLLTDVLGVPEVSPLTYMAAKNARKAIKQKYGYGLKEDAFNAVHDYVHGDLKKAVTDELTKQLNKHMINKSRALGQFVDSKLGTQGTFENIGEKLATDGRELIRQKFGFGVTDNIVNAVKNYYHNDFKDALKSHISDQLNKHLINKSKDIGRFVDSKLGTKGTFENVAEQLGQQGREYLKKYGLGISDTLKEYLHGDFKTAVKQEISRLLDNHMLDKARELGKLLDNKLNTHGTFENISGQLASSGRQYIKDNYGMAMPKNGRKKKVNMAMDFLDIEGIGEYVPQKKGKAMSAGAFSAGAMSAGAKSGGAKSGGKRPKRPMSEKQKQRAQLVSKIMKENGLSLGEASKEASKILNKK